MTTPFKRKTSKKKTTKLLHNTLFNISLLDQSHIESLRIAYNLMDKDGSGEIDPGELRAVVNKFDTQITEDELDDMIAEADEFGDGEIDFTEFVAFMSESITKKKDCEGFMKRVFDYFDTEGNELIGLEGLKEMMNDNGEKINDQELANMMEEGAFVNEGKLNFIDFLRPMVFPADDK
jgi:calmodulin